MKNPLLRSAQFGLFTLVMLGCDQPQKPLVRKTETPRAPLILDTSSVQPSEADLAALEDELMAEEERFEEEMTKIDLLELEDALKLAERKLARQKRLLEWSETRYLEKLKIICTNFVVLEVRMTPGIFAGELPEKDVFVFLEFIEACEGVEEVLDIMLAKDITDGGNGQYVYPLAQNRASELEVRRKEITVDINKTFPSTGSVVEDALIAIQRDEFKELSQRVNEKAIEFVGSASSTAIGEARKTVMGENRLLQKGILEAGQLGMEFIKMLSPKQ